MRSTALLVFLSVYVSCHQSNIPNVQLTGKSWIVGRKYHRSNIDDVHAELQNREPVHLNDGVRRQVNAHFAPNSYTGTGDRVVVYKRIIRPMNAPPGSERVLSTWIGNLGEGQIAYEHNTLLRESPVDGR